MLLPLILIVMGVGIVFAWLFEKKVIFNSDLSGAYKVHRIITETHTDETPIFGSSRAEGGFIPDTLGANVFNYGLSGTKYNVTLFFLDEECRKKKSNPLIILNLDLDGLRVGLGDIANYVPSVGNAEVRTLIDSSYKHYYSIPFIRYYGFYDIYLRLYLNNRVQLTKFSNKGASLDRNVLTPKTFADLVAERTATETIFENNADVEAKLFNVIKSHPEKHFVFTVAPYHSSYFVGYKNLPAAMAFLGKLRAEKNVKVFDFSRLPLADSLFLNTTHVNFKGAQVFSHALKDSLASAVYP